MSGEASTTLTTTPIGRGWAYAGTMLGALVSIAANIAHSFVPPAHAPAGWQPPTGAIAFAAFWPVALFVGIEMLARVAWRRGWRMILLRFGGLLPVAGTAAIVSYLHLAGLLAHYGEPRVTVVIGPLAVDGLMVMSAAALMSTSPQAAQPAPAGQATNPGPEVPDVEADSPEDAAGQADGADSASKRGGRPRMTNEQRVAACADRYPDMTVAEMAKRLKLSDRTIRRYLAEQKTGEETALERTETDQIEHANGTTI
jgi:hypothetical protein